MHPDFEIGLIKNLFLNLKSVNRKHYMKNSDLSVTAVATAEKQMYGKILIKSNNYV